MIDRDQVLHVARLARLELTDDEVAAMTVELGKVMGHIETITELDLDGVKPTSHVVEVPVALRPDVPEPSLSLEQALDPAPARSDDGFLVPSPQAS